MVNEVADESSWAGRPVSRTARRPDRVFVFGPSGSGKTVFARALARRLGAGHVELDGLLWGPGWAMCDDESFLASAAAAAAEERWVIEGTFREDLARVVWPRAEAVVWLDYPFRTVLARLVRRTMRRAVTRERLWHGNVEPLRDLVGRASLVAWLWQSYPALPGEVERFQAVKMPAGDPVLHRFRRPAEAVAWQQVLAG